MGLKRAKTNNKKNRNADQYNFRVGTAQKKADFQSRTNKLKEEKNVSAREIYEAGLRVFEQGTSEAQILNRRNKTIAERDIFFNLFLDRNSRIIAFNRQLRNKSKRYNNYSDDKDVLIIFDDEGNELNQIQLNDETIKLKKEIEEKYK